MFIVEPGADGSQRLEDVRLGILEGLFVSDFLEALLRPGRATQEEKEIDCCESTEKILNFVFIHYVFLLPKSV